MDSDFYAYRYDQVESTLFRVHTHFLAKHSALLRDMLNVGKADASEGSSDQRPIVLPNIKATEFEHILEIFYTPCVLAIISFLH